jgi:hypothetical protein
MSPAAPLGYEWQPPALAEAGAGRLQAPKAQLLSR